MPLRNNRLFLLLILHIFRSRKFAVSYDRTLSVDHAENMLQKPDDGRDPIRKVGAQAQI